jgi:hypothetical protein
MENTDIINVFGKLFLAIHFMTILGSAISCIIFSRKAFKKSSIGIYCRSLAVFDLYITYNFVLGIVTLFPNTEFILASDLICKLAYFISSGISSIPGWVLVAFSFDQLIIVSRTDRFKFFDFQHSIILTILLVQCATSTPTIFYSGLRVYLLENNMTFFSCDSFSIVMPIIYLIESCTIPFVLIIVSTSLIVRILIKSRRNISTGLQATAQMTRRRQEYKFAFNSVVLNVLFIVLTFPLLLSYIVSINLLIKQIFFALFYLNFALHFWVHLAFNSIFRNEFFKVFRIKKRVNIKLISLTNSQRNGQ